jgi:uncharacterized membrane protein YeaQ/YmgE (transglycosylase-associated protein family)
MGIIWTILIGFFIGLIARAIKPGKDSLGFILTTILGVSGSVFAGLIGKSLGVYKPGEPVGLIAAVLGALALLFIVQYIKERN